MSRSASSRRTFLTAGTAAIVGGSTAGSLASASGSPDPIDALFRRWRASDAAACPSMCGLGEPLDDDEGDAQDAITQGIEEEIKASTASITKAAALALIEMRWECTGINEAPAQYGCGSRDSVSQDGEDHSVSTLWRILECLRPHLSGFVGEVAADYLDHPHRPIRNSLLFSSNGREA